MKKIFYALLFTFFCTTSLNAQTVVVSGQCMTGTITLNPIGNIDGKPAFEGTGTVQGFPNVQIDVYWLGAPDNLWVLAFDGQPYFQNSCTGVMPPATGGTTCVWTAVSGQTCTGVNPLDINGSGTLDAKIISFTARKNNKEVILNWITASETNNKGFEIQRSADGINWSKIAFVNGSINSSAEKNYQFTDATPFSGRNFYRIRQLDLDNKATLSSIVVVKVLQSGFYSISNNPGNGLYNLHIETGLEKINFSVTDVNGKRIFTKIYNGTGDQQIDITKYSSGIYLLQIQKGKDVFTEKLIKL